MKQLLFTIVLFTLCISLSALTGLFGVSFNQNRDDAQKMLTEAGFKVESSTDEEISLTNPKIKGLIDLVVKFGSSGGVSSWEIEYDTKDHSGLIEEVISQLSELHDTEPLWDEYWEEWVWKLEYGLAIYMYESWDILRVDYDVWDDSYDY